jgi:hypothetical protein
VDEVDEEHAAVTPTIGGRLQTRIFLLAVIGSLWTLLVGPLLPRPDGASLGDVYVAAFKVLAIVTVVGLAWELLYHGLQQFRWEKDWPTLYGFLTGINEGLLAWYLAIALGLVEPAIPTSAFVVHFTTTWIVTWLWANGPMRVLFLRWRFVGGRIV